MAFLAFGPLESIENDFDALSIHIAGTYPELLAVNNIENNYFGQATPEGSKTCLKVSQGVLGQSNDQNDVSRIS